MEATAESKHSIMKSLMLTRNDERFQRLSLRQLIAKRAQLKKKWNKFQIKYERAINRVKNAEATDEQAEQYEMVEGQYITALSRINERIMQLENEQPFEQEHDLQWIDEPEHEVENAIKNLPVQSNATVQAPIVVQVQNKQLDNTWGEFDGALTKWQGFHDRFCHAVHNDNLMPNSVKFQHLQRSLKGRALISFGDWDGSDESYPEAWARMKELYSREFQISKELLRKFNGLPKLEYASSGMLQKLSNVTHEVLRQLRALKYPVEHYDLFFVHSLHDKLDAETRKIYELNRNSERPKIHDMLNFLDQHAKALQGLQLTENNFTKDNRKRHHSNHDSENLNFKRLRIESSGSKDKFEKRDFKTCRVCKEAHPVIHCAKYKKIETLNERRNVANKHELCYNCLRPYHSAKECYADGCKRCDGAKHNSLLCPKNPLMKSVNSTGFNKEKSVNKKHQSRKQ